MSWDVFISHASEDKESFVRLLAEALHGKGVKVWYDEKTLTVGDRLRESIDEGLAKSRFAIAVLSPSYFNKKWTKNELDGLIALEESKGKFILPILHGMSVDELKTHSSMLAGRVSISTDQGLEGVVSDLLRKIDPDKVSGGVPPEPWQTRTPAKSDKRNFPWILAYLPNRNEQETRLSYELPKDPKRPFVCITHCDENECNDTYFKRLEVQSLCKCLGLDPKKVQLHRESFSWPNAGDSVDERFRALLSNLADALTGNRADAMGAEEHLIEKLSRIVINHLTNKSGVMIDAHVFTKNACRDEMALIGRFLDFWKDWADLDRGGFLCVCIGIVYSRTGNLNFFKKRFSEDGQREKRNRSIEGFIKKLDFSRYDGLHGVVLPKLPPITRDQAKDWVRVTVRDFFSEQGRSAEFGKVELDLFGRIESMYDDCGEDSIPMRKLAGQLEEILKEVW